MSRVKIIVALALAVLGVSASQAQAYLPISPSDPKVASQGKSWAYWGCRYVFTNGNPASSAGNICPPPGSSSAGLYYGNDRPFASSSTAVRVPSYVYWPSLNNYRLLFYAAGLPVVYRTNDGVYHTLPGTPFSKGLWSCARITAEVACPAGWANT